MNDLVIATIDKCDQSQTSLTTEDEQGVLGCQPAVDPAMGLTFDTGGNRKEGTGQMGRRKAQASWAEGILLSAGVGEKTERITSICFGSSLHLAKQGDWSNEKAQLVRRLRANLVT